MATEHLLGWKKTYSIFRISKTSTTPSDVPVATSECFAEYAHDRTGAWLNDLFWKAFIGRIVTWKVLASS